MNEQLNDFVHFMFYSVSGSKERLPERMARMRKILWKLFQGTLAATLISLIGRGLMALQYSGIESDLVRFCYESRDNGMMRIIIAAVLGLHLGMACVELTKLIIIRICEPKETEKKTEG